MVGSWPNPPYVLDKNNLYYINVNIRNYMESALSIETDFFVIINVYHSFLEHKSVKVLKLKNKYFITQLYASV